LVPFERFYLRKDATAAREWVIVLWVAERYLGVAPVESLYNMLKYSMATLGNAHARTLGLDWAELWKRLAGAIKQLVERKELPDYQTLLELIPARCSVTVIGPASSDGLVEMMREYSDALKPGAWSAVRRLFETKERFTYYSNFATAPIPDLLAEAGASLDHKRPLGNHLQSIMPDDLSLTKALIEELDLRFVRRQDNSHIVLISESDTFYGRSWPPRFTNEWAEATARSELDEWKTSKTIWAAAEPALAACRKMVPAKGRVHSFSYLRGLDGDQPKSDSSRKVEKESTRFVFEMSPTASSESEISEEAPVGPGQFDYVRRLIERIHATERKVRGTAGGKIAAIGVVGSDVFDKLVLLQVLREEFSGVVFFTTDLDAHLLLPSQLPFTRNLIVASHFGLSLSDQLQGGVPSFRDCYQTATYSAVSKAIDSPGFKEFEPPSAPRIYEISSSGAYDLTGLKVPKSDPRPDSPREHRWLFDTSSASFPRWFWFFCVAVLAGGTLIRLLIAEPTRVRAEPGVPVWRRVVRRLSLSLSNFCQWVTKPVPMLLSGACVILIYFIQRDHSLSAGEPFALVLGISVWPSVLLCAFACLLSLSYLSRVRKREKASFRTIDNQYFGEPEKLLSVVNSARCQIERVLDYAHTARGAEFRRLWQSIFALDTYRNGLLFCRSVVKAIITFFDLKRAKRLPLRSRRKLRLLCFRLFADSDAVNRAGYSDRIRKRRLTWVSHLELDPKSGKFSARQLWEDYKQLARTPVRNIRVVLVGGIYVIFGYGLIALGEWPFIPVRGPVSEKAHLIVLICAAIALVFLVFYVLDAVHLCHRFVDKLASMPTPWDKGVLIQHAKLHRIKDPEYMSDWLDVKLTAELTRTTGNLIYYPFVILLIMFVARDRTFDNWDWPVSLIMIFFCTAAAAVLAVVTLHRGAEDARKKAIGNLQAIKVGLMASGPTSPSGKPLDPAERAGLQKQVEELITELKELKEGAYRGWKENPVIRAVLIPLGGVGSLAALEYFVSSGF